MKYETTIFIPTHNRPQQLNRLLKFLGDRLEGICVVVADSSDDRCLVQNRKSIASSALATHVRHLDYTGVSRSDKYLDAIGHVPTETICFCGDDDLLIPEQVLRSSRFLMGNDQFSHARGRMLTFLNSPLVGLKRSLRNYPQWQIAMDHPIDRLKFHLNHYISNFYSVRRTGPAKRNLERVMSMDIGSGLQERLLPFLDLLDGKGAVFPELFMFRQKGQTLVDESGNITFWDKRLSGNAYAAELTRNAAAYLGFIKDEVRSRIESCSDEALDRLMSAVEREMRIFFLDKENPKRISVRRIGAAIDTLSLKSKNGLSMLHETADSRIIEKVVRHIESHR